MKNTGRCKELLRKGVRVYWKSSNPERKTAYDLVGVEKKGLMVNMDSAAPNKAAGEWLASGGLFPDGGAQAGMYLWQFQIWFLSGNKRKQNVAGGERRYPGKQKVWQCFRMRLLYVRLSMWKN